MPSSLIFKAGALALACASTASAVYTLAPEDTYEGATFFDGFIFNTSNDATHGFVDYLGPGDTLFSQLAHFDPVTGTNYMGVDYWNAYSPVQSDTNRGRPSIRAQTAKTYTYGLFVVDLAHMPAGSCGTWPAFWTTSLAHWPEQGQIDIIENINSASYSKETLHAGATFPGDVCEVVGNVNTKPGQQTGTQTTYNCQWNATTSDYGSGTQFSGQGCSADNNDPYNFGTAFNNVQGGVYVMEWTDELIQIWSFGSGPGSTPPPTDLQAGTPDPTLWDKPIFTTWGGNCDIARHFIDHTVIFDTTFCGDWAGQQAIWETTSCYDPVAAPTCQDFVAANNGVGSYATNSFRETYWAVNSLKVYQWSVPVVSSSSTSSSPTSTSSTSSAAATTSSAATTTSTYAPSSTAISGPVPTVSGYTEIGCYTEATSSRALTLASKINYSTMTWEICADFCTANGALYFGVEYSGECYCGNEFEAGSVPATFSDCNMPCAGDATETCGGSDRLNVFQYGVTSPSSSTSSVVATSSSVSESSSSFSPSSSSFSSAAASSTPDVSSSSSTSYSPAATSTTSTTSSSLSSAATSSTEAASSSSSVINPISAAPSTSDATSWSSSSSSAWLTSSSSSEVPSSTSSSSAAATTTSVLVVPSHVSSVSSCTRIGCYTEGYNTRALTPFANTDYAAMSPEICSAECPGYLYFGVEYGGECYCGNQINNGSTIVDDSQCSMPCDGYPGEYCGAGNRLDVYFCGSTSSSSSSAAPTTSSAWPTSSSSSLSAVSSSSVAASSSSGSSQSSSYAAPSTSFSWPSSPSSSSAAATSSTTSSASSSSTSNETSSSIPTTSNSAAASSTPSFYTASSVSLSSSSSVYTISSSITKSSTATDSSTIPITSNSAAPSSTSSSYTTSSVPLSSGSAYIYTNSSSPTTTSSTSISLTTSIVQTTITSTILSCAPTVTNCPYGKVTTVTIDLYTTICPVTGTESSIPTTTSLSGSEQTTITVSTTTVYTITSCAATVTNCPAKMGQVTTDTIVLYTTVCPVSEALSLRLITAPAATPVPTSVVAGVTGVVSSGAVVPTGSASTSTTVISSTVTKIITATVKPLISSPIGNSNSTAPSSTAGIFSSKLTLGASSPSSSPITYKAGSGASGLQTGSGLALIVVAGFAALFL